LNIIKNLTDPITHWMLIVLVVE